MISAMEKTRKGREERELWCNFKYSSQERPPEKVTVK